jgi:hypothetical protein
MIDQKLKIRMIMLPVVPEITGIYQGTDTFLANFCACVIDLLFFSPNCSSIKRL